MSRRVGEPVAVRVRRAEHGPRGDDAVRPASFLWRGRVYVVREILAHWRERRDWWTTGPARAVHGLDPQGSAGPATDQLPAGPAGAQVSLDAEHDVWRVEASPGLSFPGGVYDLSRRPQADAEDDWLLTRVGD